MKQKLKQIAFSFVIASLALACVRPHSPPPKVLKASGYGNISDAKDWLNPFLIIERDGVTAICNAIAPNERKHIPMTAVSGYLRGLPQNAWPYGKVVGLQENGIRSGNDDRLINENKKAIEPILKTLKIKPYWWPT